jgi:tetratricopeptide (TPR) repeat protein
MAETPTFALDEAHRHFAKSINRRVWELLQKSVRSQADNDEMLNGPRLHVSLEMRRNGGPSIAWRISRVHAVLGHVQEALRHAQRCFELTEANRDSMQNFDVAYAYEGLARTYELSGDVEKARKYFYLAQHAGEET